MVSCAKCGEKGHSVDTVLVRTPPGTRPRFACNQHDRTEMQSRVRAVMVEMPPTVRRKRELAEAGKRRLAQLTPMERSRFQAHSDQAALADSAGLGGAAASASVRLAEGTTAALQDDGASRAAARTLGAFDAESTASGAGESSVPPPGPLGTIDATAPRQTVVNAIDEALRKRPRYSPGTRGAMRPLSTEAGQATTSTREVGEVTGSSNP